MTCPKCAAPVRVVHSQVFHNGETVTVFRCLNGHSKRVPTDATEPTVGMDQIRKEEVRRAQISEASKRYWKKQSPAQKKAQGQKLNAWRGTPRVGR